MPDPFHGLPWPSPEGSDFSDRTTVEDALHFPQSEDGKVPDYVQSMTNDWVRVYAHRKPAVAALRSLGAKRGWLARSFWALRCTGDDNRELARKFGVLRDGGIGFQEDNRDYSPAAWFDMLVENGFLSGTFLRVSHAINGLGRPVDPGRR